MAQANTDNSITSRRRFLTVAAAAVTIPAVSLASGDVDPIFAAIEAHRRVTEATKTIVIAHNHLEQALPKYRRQSNTDIDGEEIVETDAPEWITGERAVWAALDAETEAALHLASIMPTTTAGAAAILAYTAESPNGIGSKFPDFEDDDGVTRDFEFFIIQNCAEALTNISAAA